MPEINAVWNCDAEGKLSSLKLTQHDVLPDNFVWPISNEIVLGVSGEHLRADWSTAETTVPGAVGKPCPAFVFANRGDEAYGRFLLDPRSEETAREILVPPTKPTATPNGLPTIASRRIVPEPLLRSMLWGALWDNVRVAKSPPRGYVELVETNLPHEWDETLARIQGGHATTALQKYMTSPGRDPLVPTLEAIATERMLHASDIGLRIVNFRALTAVAETPAARSTLKGVLAGEVTIPGVELRPLDRWNLIGRLIALHDPEAYALLTAELGRDHSGDGPKYAFAMSAAAPDPAVKQGYFAQYTTAPGAPDAKPEDWLTLSLHAFNSPNQGTLTEPYLRRALDQLPEIKRDRKIFFLGAWLNAFFDGQTSSEAEAQVQEWLGKPDIDPDLRRKVLENNDELERTVRIRIAFPN